MSFSALIATADRAALTHLGCAVSYTPSDGTALTVQGIFDSAYVRADAGTAGLSTCGPAVFLNLADLPDGAEDDSPAIVIAGVSYTVRESKPDGMGGLLLLLHRA
jgi:hypothetical protein